VYFTGGGNDHEFGHAHGVGHADHDSHGNHTSVYPVRRRSQMSVHAYPDNIVVYPRVRRTAYYPSTPSWGWEGDHTWHNTSHWDYHPTEIRRHGDHYHVTPGHYDWHETGHIDHYHP
jgi:hypothetical protein